MRCFYHFRRNKKANTIRLCLLFLEHKGMDCYDYVCVGTASLSDNCKIFHLFKVLLSFM